MLNYNFLHEDGSEVVEIVFTGIWSIYDYRPSVKEIIDQIRTMSATCITIDAARISSWDTSFINFILELRKECIQMCWRFDENNLPRDVLNILTLVENTDVSQSNEQKGEFNSEPISMSRKICTFFQKNFLVCRNGMEFLGEIILESWILITGRSKFRSKEFWQVSELVGVQALGIVALISFLVGLILAFISIIQLSKLGAGIYCADLVGIAMMREMGCLMTAIIMSGRTGAAFAATIGTMMVNEEIDAIKTSGLSCFRFIIIPRILALLVMMPLLCIFSDIIGVAGGMFAAITMLDMNISQYFAQTQSAIVVADFLCGFIKSIFFAFLVGGIGCWQGMRCGRDAEAVGQVTTSAVVESITAIIIADAIFAVIFNALGV